MIRQRPRAVDPEHPPRSGAIRLAADLGALTLPLEGRGDRLY